MGSGGALIFSIAARSLQHYASAACGVTMMCCTKLTKPGGLRDIWFTARKLLRAWSSHDIVETRRLLDKSQGKKVVLADSTFDV